MVERFNYGDKVTYYDEDGEPHHALVLDPCIGDPYITVVVGEESGEPRNVDASYNYKAFVDTSVYPHEDHYDHPSAVDRLAYSSGWSEDA